MKQFYEKMKEKTVKNEKFIHFYKKYQSMIIMVLVILSIALIGIGIRIYKQIALRNQTNADAVTVVSIVQPKEAPAFEEIILPGTIQAWHEASLYARTNGYVKKWMVDIGAIVKEGDLLAEIEIPDLDAQLRQAEADLKAAKINSKLAKVSAKRWTELVKTNSVSQQETDERISDELAKAALVISAQGNRDRLRELVNFKRVIAPFNGVITSRTTDIGALITDGNMNQTPLFKIVQADPLRVYVNVPQNYSSRIKPNITANLFFPDAPQKKYAAKLINTSKAIDSLSRTLLIQLVVDNKDYILLPGSYAQVSMKLPIIKGTMQLPVNTLLFRKEGLQIATLDDKDCAILKNIDIIRDFGDHYELDSGIKQTDRIIVNPSDSLKTGQCVRVVDLKQAEKIEEKKTGNQTS